MAAGCKDNGATIASVAYRNGIDPVTQVIPLNDKDKASARR